ncbi:MAG: methyl-accepting chemotaxis protein [Candidatus Schekmanbacteria bacterium]|nr:methyl-accepting chemotaxis protein [Candidatus Schekmanbacteria bacterium]
MKTTSRHLRLLHGVAGVGAAAGLALSLFYLAAVGVLKENASLAVAVHGIGAVLVFLAVAIRLRLLSSPLAALADAPQPPANDGNVSGPAADESGAAKRTSAADESGSSMAPGNGNARAVEAIFRLPMALLWLCPGFVLTTVLASTVSVAWTDVAATALHVAVCAVLAGVVPAASAFLLAERQTEQLAATLPLEEVTGYLQQRSSIAIRLDTRLRWLPVLTQAVAMAMLMAAVAHVQRSGPSTASVLLAVAITVAAFAFGAFAGGLLSQGISASVLRLVATLGEAKEGSLRVRAQPRSSHEIGMLAAHFNLVFENFEKIFEKVKTVSESVAAVADRLTAAAQEMSDGVELQATSTETTSSSIEEMSVSINQVAANVEHLSHETEISSSSTMEMTLSIEEVAKNIESLSTSVDATSSSIEEMTATVKEVAANAERLAFSSAQVAEAMESIDHGLGQVEEYSKESSKLSGKVSEDAMQGAASVAETINEIQKIREAVLSSQEVIEALGGRSEEIGKILNVIDDVASQTNLLALNAAIIAAQAGEHGKAFAVVAQEIRDLAERTAASTREIAALIKTVQSEAVTAVARMGQGAKTVESGVTLSERAGNALQKIIHSTEQSSGMTYKIEKATIEQTERSREVTEAVHNFQVMARQIAKATREQTIGIEQIMRESENIRDMAEHVRRATIQQAQGSKQISTTVEHVTEMTQEIVKATQQQKKGAHQIVEAIEVFKEITLKNLDTGMEMERAVDALGREATSLSAEISRVK